MIPDRIEVNIAGGLDIALPRMLTVRQKFEAERLTDIAGTVAQQFQRAEVRDRVKPDRSSRSAAAAAASPTSAR
jgi:hypothetical protein